MAGKNTAVFGIYPMMPNLENGLNELKQAGFRHEDVSVLFPENLGSKELATVKATKAPEGVASGAGSGAVLGGGCAATRLKFGREKRLKSGEAKRSKFGKER